MRWHLGWHGVAVKPRDTTDRRDVNTTGQKVPMGLSSSALSSARLVHLIAALLGAAAAMMPTIAHSSQAAGSASSGSVQISVSVATKYKVRTADLTTLIRGRRNGHSGRFCLATNSSTPAMPIRLVPPSAHRLTANDTGLLAEENEGAGMPPEAWRCSLMDESFAEPVAGRWWLVRPE